MISLVLQILTSAIAPFLFILVDVLFEFNIVPCVYIFIVPSKRERHTILPDGTDVHIQQHIHQKDLNICLALYFHARVIVELEKTQTKNAIILRCL